MIVLINIFTRITEIYIFLDGGLLSMLEFDGFSWMLVFIQCSTNNRAETVFSTFHNGVSSYGLPSRVRTDKGGEYVA